MRFVNIFSYPVLACVCLLFFVSFEKFIFFYFWLCWIFTCCQGFPLIAVSGACSVLLYAGFSLQRLGAVEGHLLLQSRGSRHMGFCSGSCGSWTLFFFFFPTSLFACRYPVVSAPFVEKTVLSLLNCICTFLAN